MAVETKTYVNDSNSFLVKEIVDQLNSACSVTVPTVAQNLGGASAVGAVVLPTAEANAGVLFRAEEDCFVESIKILTLTTQLDAIAPDDTEFIILQVPSSYADGAGAAQTSLTPTSGIHGASNTAFGSTNCTYTVVLATDGNLFTDANGFDIGRWAELLGRTSTGGATAIPADAFNATFLAADSAVTAAVNSPSTLSLTAGDSLVWGLENTSGGNVSLVFSVCYRPVKDRISLVPGTMVKRQSFTAAART